MTRDYLYDVALSFAGAQRPAAEAIAALLKAAGLRIFYDADETAALWGKDLAATLHQVYGQQSRYCLMLVSEAYRDRMWTRHERKSALARALNQSEEYILPVRFDDTALDGIPHTIGYVTFQSPEQIAGLIIAKLGNAATPRATRLSCALSRRLYLGRHEHILEATIPVVDAQWGNDTAAFTLAPDDSTDAEFLNSLRTTNQLVPLAFQHNVGASRRFAVTHHMAAGKDTWRIQAQLEEVEYTTSMEVTVGDLTPERQAELRARRLLLNEQPRQATTDLNAIAEELYISGEGYGQGVTHSPLPHLYHVLGATPDRFLEAAWITAVYQLKATGTVKEILHLNLTLENTILHVDFLGRRHQRFTNVPAAQVRCTGDCPLRSAG